MTEVLEWIKCRSCGRRFRWRADLADSTCVCACGAPVFCPAIEEPDWTPVDGEADAGTSAPHLGPPSIPDVIALEFPRSDEPARASRGSRSNRPDPFGRVVLWVLGAALGLALVIHALVTMYWWSIAFAVVWAPISFSRFWAKKKRWQGSRSLLRAFVEEMEGDEPWTANDKGVDG